MLSLTVTELRRKLPAYLRRVEEGESFLITVHGRTVARLVPQQEAARAAYARLVALRPASWLEPVMHFERLSMISSGHDTKHISQRRER
jgi:prevent-host-death family protein